MKKTIFMLAVTAFVAGAMLTSCQSSSEKVESAQEKVQDAKNLKTRQKHFILR